MKKNSWRQGKLAAVVLLSLATITGGKGFVAEAAPHGNQQLLAGTVIISAGSEIEMNYDKKGKVIAIEGKNQEGKKVVESYSDYEGKSCERVIGELVHEIYEAGYLEDTGKDKAENIILKLEAGSQYPEDDFLRDLAQEALEAAAECGLKSTSVKVDDDYKEKGYIGEQRAKELALAQFHLPFADFHKQEYDPDDGVYELEFYADGIKYEVDVDAVNGNVVKAEKDHDDNWAKDDQETNDRDDRYDDNQEDDDREGDDHDDIGFEDGDWEGDDHENDDQGGDGREENDRNDDDYDRDDRYEDDRRDKNDGDDHDDDGDDGADHESDDNLDYENDDYENDDHENDDHDDTDRDDDSRDDTDDDD